MIKRMRDCPKCGRTLFEGESCRSITVNGTAKTIHEDVETYLARIRRSNLDRYARLHGRTTEGATQ
jgi:hypothetical protein